jgi:hypothetical protein
MKLPILCSLVLLASCASTEKDASPQEAAAPASTEAARAPSATTLAQFEQLKGLAGDWYAPDDLGKPTGEVMLSYRVSSNNTAVIETTFPGQDFEMTTVYTLDRADLVLTHYCALGNAPSMQAVDDGDDSRVHFECTGVGNAKSHDDQHMHDAVFRFEDDGRLRSTWTLWGDGQVGGAEEFEYVRGQV